MKNNICILILKGIQTDNLAELLCRLSGKFKILHRIEGNCLFKIKILHSLSHRKLDVYKRQLLRLLILLGPGHVVCVQAASDQTTVELKLSQGTRRYDYAYRVLDLVKMCIRDRYYPPRKGYNLYLPEVWKNRILQLASELPQLL